MHNRTHVIGQIAHCAQVTCLCTVFMDKSPMKIPPFKNPNTECTIVGILNPLGGILSAPQLTISTPRTIEPAICTAAHIPLYGRSNTAGIIILYIMGRRLYTVVFDRYDLRTKSLTSLQFNTICTVSAVTTVLVIMIRVSPPISVTEQR